MTMRHAGNYFDMIKTTRRKINDVVTVADLAERRKLRYGEDLEFQP